MWRYGFTISLVLVLFFSGCNKKTSSSTMIIPKNKPKEVDVNALDFTQGVLYYDLTISDAKMQLFLDEMAYNSTYLKDNYYTQNKDSLYIKDFIDKNPEFWSRFGLLPFVKNQVYLSGFEGVYLGESFTFKIQNKYNDLLQSGQVYISSRQGLKSAFNLNYYWKSPILNELQLPIDLSYYQKQQSIDSIKVANYNTQKVIYTLREDLDNPPGDLPYRICVYSSDLFYESLNRVLPFCINQTSGVLRLDITFNKNDTYYFIFQATSIVRREVLEQEYQSLQGSESFNVDNNKELNEFITRVNQIKEYPKIN